MHPTDQIEGESDSAYRAFCIWVETPKKLRSLPAFSEVLSRDHGIELTSHTIADYRADFRWYSRLRAFRTWQMKEKQAGILQKLIDEEVAIASQQLKVRRDVLKKSRELLVKLKPDSIDVSDMRQVCGFFDATRKAMETMGLGVLDHGDQLRRLSTQGGSGSGPQQAETEAVIPPIPPEPGCVQYPDSEAETVLEPPAGDSEGVG